VHAAEAVGGDFSGAAGCGGTKGGGGQRGGLAGALHGGLFEGHGGEVYDGRDSACGDAGGSRDEAV
jgi:hypothetical protein